MTGATNSTPRPEGANINLIKDAKPNAAKPERPVLERQFPQLAGRFGPTIERDDFNNPGAGLFSPPAGAQNGRAAYENGSFVVEGLAPEARLAVHRFVRMCVEVTVAFPRTEFCVSITDNGAPTRSP